jgi:hypothetical protein
MFQRCLPLPSSGRSPQPCNPEHSHLCTRRRENPTAKTHSDVKFLRVYVHCHVPLDFLCSGGKCQAVSFAAVWCLVKFSVDFGYNDSFVNLGPKPLFYSGLHDFIVRGIVQEYNHCAEMEKELGVRCLHYLGQGSQSINLHF